MSEESAPPAQDGVVWRLMLIFTLMVVLFSMRGQSMPERALAGCEENLRTIGLALETYAADHEGVYPGALTELVPAGLQEIPACPGGQEASTAAYTDGYQPGDELKKYRLVCAGHRHGEAGIPPEYPRIHSPDY